VTTRLTMLEQGDLPPPRQRAWPGETEFLNQAAMLHRNRGDSARPGRAAGSLNSPGNSLAPG